MFSYRLLLLLLFFAPSLNQVSAQSFMLLRFEEDYINLKDSSRNAYNRLKFVPLNKSRNVYLSFGGELREEFAGKINEDWIKGQGYNYAILQRYSLHADMHLASRLRFFIQLNSALESGSKYGPGPADEDKLNVQNLFGDYKFSSDTVHQLSFRFGRQEVNYGSGRLISVRDGNAVRQYFTGGKFQYRGPAFTFDAFAFAADRVKFGPFDNRLSLQATLWGAYAAIQIQGAENLDVYYLGIKRDKAEFEEGKQDEIRHTVAARFWKTGESFTYNTEAAYQFGKFGQGNISAWTVAVELGYIFKDLKFQPSVNLRNDYISGDRQKGDGTLQTFNALYPKGGYFGFNPLVGPSNLIDLHPYLILTMTRSLSLQGDLVFNWRYSLQDGVYHPSGHFNAPGAGSAHRNIGTSYLISMDYQFNDHLTMNCGVQYFQAGKYIKDIKPSYADSKYANIQLSFKF